MTGTGARRQRRRRVRGGDLGGDDGHGCGADALLLTRLAAGQRRDAEVDGGVGDRARRGRRPAPRRAAAGPRRASWRAAGSGVGRGCGVGLRHSAAMIGVDPVLRISRICLRVSGGVAGCSGVLIPCSGRGDASRCIGRPRRARGTTRGGLVGRDHGSPSTRWRGRGPRVGSRRQSAGRQCSARDRVGRRRRSERGPTTHHGPSN